MLAWCGVGRVASGWVEGRYRNGIGFSYCWIGVGLGLGAPKVSQGFLLGGEKGFRMFEKLI